VLNIPSCSWPRPDGLHGVRRVGEPTLVLVRGAAVPIGARKWKRRAQAGAGPQATEDRTRATRSRRISPTLAANDPRLGAARASVGTMASNIPRPRAAANPTPPTAPSTNSIAAIPPPALSHFR